jgi:peroxiredoxin
MAFTLALGQKAPDFDLPGVDGKQHSLAGVKSAKALVVVFTCNHCPAAIGTQDRIIRLYEQYQPKGVELIAISSNETVGHPTDSFKHMQERAKEKGFKFAYCFDESQDVAKAYGALRTPHFYVFDQARALRYTGRFDDNPYDPAKATTHELADALDALLAGKAPAVPMTNPIGCNVKWKGMDAHWMPPEACDLV